MNSLLEETSHRAASTRRESRGAAPKTLVVPLDGSEDGMRALPIAGRLAAALGADVVLVAAEPPDSPDFGSGSPTWLPHMGSRVAARVARTVVVPNAEVPDALRTLATSERGPVVCMATQAHAPIGHTWLGSLAEAVLSGVPCPVVLVGPRCDPAGQPHGPIVAALDGSSAALDALGSAVEWDRALGCGITLVHVAHPLDTDLVPDVVLEAATTRYPDADMRTCVLRSREPEWEVVDRARQLGASLVVCSTHGRRGVARVLLGSVATGIVRRAACPVLVQRPPFTQCEGITSTASGEPRASS